jgi:hypothetical protein
MSGDEHVFFIIGAVRAPVTLFAFCASPSLPSLPPLPSLPQPFLPDSSTELEQMVAAPPPTFYLSLSLLTATRARS